MKRDEVRGIIEGITDEQLNALMKLAGDAVNAEKAKTTAIQKQLDQATDMLKEADDEKKRTEKAAMTLEERIKAMEDSYAAKEKELSIEKNKLHAQKIFTAAGLDEEAYAPLMATVVSSDFEATESNANAIAALVAAQREAAEKSVRKSLLEQTPKPSGSTGGAQTVTKEQFASMSYSDLVKLQSESPDTYKELMKD